MEREHDWKMGKTKEAKHIRLQGAAMSRDQVAFLSGIYDPLFANLQKICIKFMRFSAASKMSSVTPRMSTVVAETSIENIR